MAGKINYPKIRSKKEKLLIIFSLILPLLLVGFIGTGHVQKKLHRQSSGEFGVTFSPKRAEELGLDWQETFLGVLNDLEVRQWRLSAYWDLIEREPGVYDFTDLDWQIDQISKKQGKIILTVGQRLPGWPECHWPKWVDGLDKESRQEKILGLIQEVVERYQDNPSIWAWQVENEPFLSTFGECPSLDREFFNQELALVRFLDHRPVIVSESGELSTWINGAKAGDILGTTLYRAVWNKYFKYFYYPYPPVFYYLKGQIVKSLTGIDQIVVVELQGEPWSPEGDITEMSLDEQYKTMNFERFRKIIHYSQETGFGKFYFWGVEWWYWLKQQGHLAIWEYAKTIF